MMPHLSCHDAAPSPRSVAFAAQPATPSAVRTSTASSTVEPTVIPCGAAEAEEDDAAVAELALVTVFDIVKDVTGSESNVSMIA